MNSVLQPGAKALSKVARLRQTREIGWSGLSLHASPARSRDRPDQPISRASDEGPTALRMPTAVGMVCAAGIRCVGRTPCPRAWACAQLSQQPHLIGCHAHGFAWAWRHEAWSATAPSDHRLDNFPLCRPPTSPRNSGACFCGGPKRVEGMGRDPARPDTDSIASVTTPGPGACASGPSPRGRRRCWRCGRRAIPPRCAG